MLLGSLSHELMLLEDAVVLDVVLLEANIAANLLANPTESQVLIVDKSLARTYYLPRNTSDIFHVASKDTQKP